MRIALPSFSLAALFTFLFGKKEKKQQLPQRYEEDGWTTVLSRLEDGRFEVMLEFCNETPEVTYHDSYEEAEKQYNKNLKYIWRQNACNI